MNYSYNNSYRYIPALFNNYQALLITTATRFNSVNVKAVWYSDHYQNGPYVNIQTKWNQIPLLVEIRLRVSTTRYLAYSTQTVTTTSTKLSGVWY